MWFAYGMVIVYFTTMVASLSGKLTPEQTLRLNGLFDANTLLLCFGIISVCERLDKIIKKIEE